MRNITSLITFIICMIVSKNAVSQNNFVGTWEGWGLEEGDNIDYNYIGKMIIDQQIENDTLYCKVYLQALNGNKTRSFVAFKGLLEESNLRVLNNTIKPKGSYTGEKSFTLVLEENQLILNGAFNEPNVPTVYLKLAKVESTKERTVDEDRLLECQAKNNKNTENQTIDKIGEISSSCIADQLDLKNAKYTYNNRIGVLAIKIKGLMPINLVMNKAAVEKFLKNKAQTTIQFKAIEEVRFSNFAFGYESYNMIQGIDILATSSATVSNPSLGQSIKYPQPELEEISLKPMFQDVIVNKQARKP